MSTSRVLAFVSITLLICGCTKTVHQRAVEYHPGAMPTTQPVPATAVYSIRFVDAKGKKFGGIPSSHVYLNKGEPIGFAFDGEGKLRGIAGTYSFAVDPPAHHGMVWSASYRKPTQFAKEVAKVAGPSFEGARETLVVCGISAFVAFAIYAWWRDSLGK